jgi:hypothetical protein
MDVIVRLQDGMKSARGVMLCPAEGRWRAAVWRAYLEDGRSLPSTSAPLHRPAEGSPASSPPSQHGRMKWHRGQAHFEPLP